MSKSATVGLPARTCICTHRRYDHEWESGLKHCFKWSEDRTGVRSPCVCLNYQPTTNENPKKDGGGPR